MKSIKFDKNSKEFQIMMAWWKLYQECYECENDTDWETLVNKTEKLNKEYKEYPLMCDLLVNLINDVERRWKNE